MKQFILLVPLMLIACATPVAPPLASTGLDGTPPVGATVPPVHCCSSPAPAVVAEHQRWPAPQSQLASKATESLPLPAAPPSELALATSNRAFAVSLYRQLAAKPGNVFISPISIAGAFGMVAAGARGQTRAEIGKVLHFPADDDVLNGNLGSIMRTLETGDGPQVSIANALWPDKHAAIEPGFIDLAKRSYDAEVDTLDFKDSPAAAARINAWVDRETNSRIPELFKADAFDPTTALVVTNAVYFLGNWSQQFDPRRTIPQPFYLADGTTREVPMMVAHDIVARLTGPEPGAASFAVNDGLQLLELPYKGGQMSMVFMLPNARNGLPTIEAKLSASKVEEWLQRLDAAPLYGPSDALSVALPKVQIENSYDLVKPLKALGMTLPFIPYRADFTGISKDRGNPLFINQVLHRTFLRIDEKGTEAAAATGIEFRGERGGPGFRADHPFLFLIRDKRTGAILFLGRVAKP